MPTHKSAAKRMKTAAKARLRNRKVKTDMRVVLKSVETEKDTEKKAKNINIATSLLDKATGKGVIHRNKAARIKSRMVKASKKK